MASHISAGAVQGAREGSQAWPRQRAKASAPGGPPEAGSEAPNKGAATILFGFLLRLTRRRPSGRLPALFDGKQGEWRGMSWHPVLEEAKLGDGEIAQGEAGGESLALYRVGDKVYATQELCTHAYV